jgi:hypothetical protein
MIQMKVSFVLGIMGGIFSLLSGVLVLFLAGASASSVTPYVAFVFVAGILGIIGGIMGKRTGGIILIVVGVGGALVALSPFSVLSFILMIIGGTLAIREKTNSTVQKKEET